jgi:hypothetical protein
MPRHWERRRGARQRDEEQGIQTVEKIPIQEIR